MWEAQGGFGIQAQVGAEGLAALRADDLIVTHEEGDGGR